jgi:hypothetical protein
MSFLDGYEDVNARIKRARAEFPGLRLVAYIEDIDLKNGYILIRAEAYKNYEDDKPSAVDYALEVRSDRGVNANFWVENCVTSAYGRVIGLLTPGGAGRPTRQDMEKVEAIQAPLQTRGAGGAVPSAAESISALKAKLGAGEPMPEPPICKHGHRVLIEGTSNKTGSPYKGYLCPHKVKASQCQPLWLKRYGDRWLAPDDYTEVMQDAGRNLDPIAEREPVPDELLSDTERANRATN